jgi:hypothetical protein
LTVAVELPKTQAFAEATGGKTMGEAAKNGFQRKKFS